MIAYLKGKMAKKSPASVILDVNGVGYEVRISLTTYDRLGKDENVMLHTYFMVKEDSQTLYGFYELKEKALFEQLISISGVGGNTALTILSSISPKEFERAVQAEDVGMLKRVKGIGAKTAARIILELKGKLVLDGDLADEEGQVPRLRQDAIDALVALGRHKANSEKLVDKIMSTEAGKEMSVEALIKEALKG